MRMKSAPSRWRVAVLVKASVTQSCGPSVSALAASGEVARRHKKGLGSATAGLEWRQMCDMHSRYMHDADDDDDDMNKFICMHRALAMAVPLFTILMYVQTVYVRCTCGMYVRCMRGDMCDVCAGKRDH